VSTLVIVGEHDFVCGPAWNRPIAEGIPGARFEIISGAGHMPQYEAADEVRRIIGEWLDATEVAPQR
jgi:pimeloyl-ACP methyl ester carboxylesterase